MAHPRPPHSPSLRHAWLQVAPWPIHLVDTEGVPAQPNPELARLLGFQISDFQPAIWAQCVPQSTRQTLAQCLSLPSGPGFRESSLRYIHRDGTALEVRRARIGPLTDSEVPTPVMLVDVAPTPLFSRAEIQAQFARLISHEFNNAFTIAQSYIQLARRQSTTPALCADYMERAAGAVERGISINHHLQLIARRDALPLEQTAINDVIGGLRTYLTRLLSPGPSWTITCEPALAPLISHPIQLARLLLDMGLNAHLRWPHSSSLTLDVRPSSGHRSTIVVRIKPDAKAAPAHPMPFRRFFLRPDLSGTPDQVSLFIDGIVDGHPVAIDASQQALIALIPAIGNG